MNFKGISYIKWINLNWKKKVTYYFVSEHILVRRWSIAFGGNLPIVVAPWHCYSSHLMSGDYVHSLVAIESKIPAWIPRIVMIQQAITTGTKPGGPGSRIRDEALQIVMHYSCTILATILHILVWVSTFKGFLIKNWSYRVPNPKDRGSNPGRSTSHSDALPLYHSG